MNCKKWELQIALDVEGDLTETQAHRLREHLASCPSCRAFRDKLASTQALIKGLGNDTVDSESLALVRDRVMETIETEARTPILRWTPWPPNWTYALTGVAAMALVSLGLWALLAWLALPGEAPQSEAPDRLAAIDESVEDEATPTPPPVALVEPEPVRPEESAPAIVSGQPPEPTPTEIEPEIRPEETASNPGEQLVVKLLTDDPNIVIYWVVEQDGGQE